MSRHAENRLHPIPQPCHVWVSIKTVGLENLFYVVLSVLLLCHHCFVNGNWLTVANGEAVLPEKQVVIYVETYVYNNHDISSDFYGCLRRIATRDQLSMYPFVMITMHTAILIVCSYTVYVYTNHKKKLLFRVVAM